MNNNHPAIKYPKLSLAGLLITLGIVYGDIGTSPLYVMKAVLLMNPEGERGFILGALSCIIWTLTLQTTVKYVLLTLRADNKGEGGILALYALIRKSRPRWIYIVAIIGASALIADGVITPSITVVSAIEGLSAVYTGTPVIPVVISILFVLFAFQQFGTKNIGNMFGPVMFIWFITLGTLGILHISDFPEILLAFNPYYGIKLLTLYPGGFLVLGAVFLCTTGAEALYSDLGHCGLKNIRVSWIFVKLCLILNYLGQGAWILHNPQMLNRGINPFFSIMPAWFLIPGVILATAAAIIASQALISGSYTILNEAMSLNFWPRQRIKYPTEIKGQLYIPFVNWFLFVACIVVVLTFQNSTNMEAAYGLSISITMLMTSILMISYLRIKKISPVFIVLFALSFLVIEISFLIANMYKFSHGGWFTILLASIIIFVMLVWFNARKIKNRYIQFVKFKHRLAIISEIKKDESIPKFATNLVYLSKANYPDEIENKILFSIINKHPKRADCYWILHVHYIDEPYTFQYFVHPLITGTLYRVELQLGFRVQPLVNLYFRQIINDLIKTGEIDPISNYPSLRKHGIPGDFRFIIIHRLNNLENNNPWEKFILSAFNVIKYLGISDIRAFGLDTSSVMLETVPLNVEKNPKIHIKRIENYYPEKEEE